MALESHLDVKVNKDGLSELAPTKLRYIAIALGIFFHWVTSFSQSPLISAISLLGCKKPNRSNSKCKCTLCFKFLVKF